MADLAPVETVAPLAETGVIEQLEHALEQARRGEIGAVAIAMVYRDGAIEGRYCFGRQPLALLFGSIDRMRHKLHCAVDAEA